MCFVLFFFIIIISSLLFIVWLRKYRSNYWFLISTNRRTITATKKKKNRFVRILILRNRVCVSARVRVGGISCPKIAGFRRERWRACFAIGRQGMRVKWDARRKKIPRLIPRAKSFVPACVRVCPYSACMSARIRSTLCACIVCVSHYSAACADRETRATRFGFSSRSDGERVGRRVYEKSRPSRHSLSSRR